MSFSFGAASGAKASGGFSFGGAAAKPTAPATAAATSTAGGFSFGAKPAAAPAGTVATAATAPSSSAGAGLAFGGGALGAVAGANTTTGAAPASSSSSAAAGRAAGASGAGGGLKFGAAASTVSAATAGGFSLAAPAATAGAAGGGALAKAPTVSFGPVTTMPAKAPPKPVHLPPAPPDLVSTDNTVKGQASNRSLLAVLRQCGGGDGAAGLVSKPWFIGRLESLTGVYSGPPVQGRPHDQTGRLPQPPESVVPAMRAKGQVYANVWAEVRGIYVSWRRVRSGRLMVSVPHSTASHANSRSRRAMGATMPGWISSGRLSTCTRSTPIRSVHFSIGPAADRLLLALQPTPSRHVLTAARAIVASQMWQLFREQVVGDVSGAWQPAGGRDIVLPRAVLPSTAAELGVVKSPTITWGSEQVCPCPRLPPRISRSVLGRGRRGGGRSVR